MSGGGKGGSTTTTVQIPAWLENAAQQNIARADRVAQLGNVRYYGPDVAAFTPMQQAAFTNTNDVANAFGMYAPMNPMAGMPQAQTFAGGVQGYSAAPLMDQSMEALRANAPAQYDYLTGMFIDPVTGAVPRYPFGSAPEASAPAAPALPYSVGAPSGNGGGSDGGMSAGIQRREANSGWFSSDLASRLPGGVNTRNPSSALNQAAAKLTSSPQRAPTAADRPKANPKRK